MKGKKEYIVLFILIAALAGYLYLQRTDRVHYDLPQIESVDAGAITGLEIASREESVSLTKKDGSWYIEPNSYSADTVKVGRMLEAISGLTLTDLVSESGSLERYSLGEADRITVRAYAGTEPIRSFDLGKDAPTHQHTFVSLPGDNRVFHAKGSFRRDFELTAADLRDRQVLSFSKDEITGIRIGSQGRETVLTRTESEPSSMEDQSDDKGGASPKRVVWMDASGVEADKPEVDALLSGLSNLDCQEYIQDLAKEQAGNPELTITLTGARDYTLSFHPARDGKTPATSSANDYVFVLPDYRQENIAKSAEKLTAGGITDLRCP